MSEIFKRPLAETDLDDIWDYLEERASQEQAADFLRKLYSKLEILSQNPYMGRIRDELLPELRSFSFKDYVFFYFPLTNGIDVVRVLHGRRDVERVFQEEEKDESDSA